MTLERNCEFAILFTFGKVLTRNFLSHSQKEEKLLAELQASKHGHGVHLWAQHYFSLFKVQYFFNIIIIL